MKIRFVWLVIFISLLRGNGAAGIKSLSHVFLAGKGVEDTDRDNWPDRVGFRIVLADKPSPASVVLAADIAARANFECLAQDMALVRLESQPSGKPAGEVPIFIGLESTQVQEWKRKSGVGIPLLRPNQGAVVLLGREDDGLAVIAGSEDALLKSGRAFFLRWPYFWEIWGREDGLTYFTLERDLSVFLQAEGAAAKEIVIRAAFYEFPDLSSSRDAVRRLKFDNGEIQDLWLEIDFADRNNKDKAAAALAALKDERLRGFRTDVLSYPGCGRLTLSFRHGGEETRVSIPRAGYPKRMLTPGYKDAGKRNVPERDFDLTSLLTSQGFYADGDRDGLLDGLETQVIVPRNIGLLSLTSLASRLVLPTSGAAFPVVQFEDEVDDIKAVSSPLLVGESAFVRQLIKTGKLKLPALRPGWAVAQVVPRAFNKSAALSILGADEAGLAKMLDYISLTFPYFSEYREGNPQLGDVGRDLEKMLKGEKGAAEAFVRANVEKIGKEIGHKELTGVTAEIFLPERHAVFEAGLENELKKRLKPEKLEVKTTALKQYKPVFSREKEFSWEVDDALTLLEEKIESLDASAGPLEVILGLSESPQVRKNVKTRVEARLRQAGIQEAEVHVFSAYKQGFFWLTENILPRLKGLPLSRLTIRFAEEKDDLTLPKRFYSEPLRWLQELYPVDEILAAELRLPLDQILFEKKEKPDPVYELIAHDARGSVLLCDGFSPRIREIPYLKVLPEWGSVKVTTGWLKIGPPGRPAFEASLPTDLEKFWEFYQDEVLSFLYSHIMKKTEGRPSTAKQPYFKRLKVELKLSEPDFRLSLDEEIVSSLEAIHDEIYFDTLDFLRGITTVELEDQELPEDTSRLSAPGNVFPVIHPSLEGKGGRVKVELEDWPAASPQLILRWKEKGRAEEETRKAVFPSLKPKSVRFPCLIFDGQAARIENIAAEIEFEKESDYLALLDILQTAAELEKAGLLTPSLSYPGVRSLTLRVKHKDLEREEVFSSGPAPRASRVEAPAEGLPLQVPTDEIISPEMCMEIIGRLGRFPGVRSYIGGRSYEDREVPVLELFTPQAAYISVPRLIAAKPTLFISARQHANEVSSTNTILKFAELLASDEEYAEYPRKVNFILQPMENPDGAALAYELQKLTPFHSLHAGRYSSLGVDIGYQVGSAKPFLPEAAVRKTLMERWLPDIHLNLHGYPSHEWVQAFSGYSPYLFRDYWIPKGWFAYYRALRLPIYDKWKEAGEELRRKIIEELHSDGRIKKSNENFYRRFWRWAARWQPHLNPLELHDGLNLYAARRSSQENRLSARTQITYIEETPELMDETARGDWLSFLSEQGLAYLRAHAKYLSRAAHEVGRIEEEIRDRVRIQFIRARPGKTERPTKGGH